jgi:hypothetical protein
MFEHQGYGKALSQRMIGSEVSTGSTHITSMPITSILAHLSSPELKYQLYRPQMAAPCFADIPTSQPHWKCVKPICFLWVWSLKEKEAGCRLQDDVALEAVGTRLPLVARPPKPILTYG